MSETTNKQSMLLIKSKTMNDQVTFAMISISKDCPYMECVFIPDTNELAIVTKETKQSFHFFPRLNDNGDYVKAVGRPSGKLVKEERKMIDTFYEYYISDKVDIETIIMTFAANAHSFDWKSFFSKAEADTTATKKKKMVVEK